MPENDHRDPGDLPITAVLAAAATFLPPPAPTPQEDPLALDPTERAQLIADIAEAVAGIHAVHPVIVADGTGAARLPDGRSIDALPTVVGELQQDTTAIKATLARILAIVEPAAAPKP